MQSRYSAADIRRQHHDHYVGGVIHKTRSIDSAQSDFEQSDRTRRLRDESTRFFASVEPKDRQRQFNFEEAPISDVELLQAVWSIFDGRCAFCSAAISDDAGPHRFRPPQDAVSADGEVDRDCYFWVAYEWQNFYPACDGCAVAQGAKFPVAAERAPVGTPWDELDVEEPLLLDPCSDDPEQDLIYLRSGEVVSTSVRGRATIDVFALNRSDLVEKRKDVADRAIALFARIVNSYEREEYSECRDYVRSGYSMDRPFAAVWRQFVNQHVQRRRRQLGDVFADAGLDLRELTGALPTITGERMNDAAREYFRRTDIAASIRVESKSRRRKRQPAEEWEGLRSVAIRSVHIKNFRGLDEVYLDLGGYPGTGRWTVLLGENGVGKTSILQAIAIVLAGRDGIPRIGLRPQDVLRQGESTGFVEIQLEGAREPLGISFGRGRSFRFKSDYTVPFAGYGATRLLPSATSRKPKYKSASFENLFDPFVALARTELWVPELSNSDFDAIARALIRLLDVADGSAFLDRSTNGTLTLVQESMKTPLSRMSSGYQATAAVALDLMRVFLDRWGSLEAAEGIVLIDEIEAHLHPRWQMRVVDSFRSAFPRVQFVVSSHSPLTLRGAADGEVVVVRHVGNRVVAESNMAAHAGMTVDQLLTSETFGLHSSIDPRVEKEFTRYYDLLAARDRGPVEDAEIAHLRDELDVGRQMGETHRERLMLEAIDEFLALQKRDRVGSQPRTNENLRAQLMELWTKAVP